MYRQGEFDLGLPELPARPKRPERLCFMLFPDLETALAIKELGRQIDREYGIKGSLLRTNRLHVSLKHVGDHKRLRTKFIFAAGQAAKVIAVDPFEITFSRVKSFDGRPAIDGRPPRRPLVLLADNGPIFNLHEALGIAMVKSGLKAGKHFVPHMTLLYGKKLIPLQAIEPIGFTVKEFALVHSKLWLSKYEVLDSWPLRG